MADAAGAGDRRRARQLHRRRRSDRPRRRHPRDLARRPDLDPGDPLRPRPRHGPDPVPAPARPRRRRQGARADRADPRRRGGRPHRTGDPPRQRPARPTHAQLAAEIAARSPDAIRRSKVLLEAGLGHGRRRLPRARGEAAARAARLAEPVQGGPGCLQRRNRRSSTTRARGTLPRMAGGNGIVSQLRAIAARRRGPARGPRPARGARRARLRDDRRGHPDAARASTRSASRSASSTGTRSASTPLRGHALRHGGLDGTSARSAARSRRSRAPSPASASSASGSAAPDREAAQTAPLKLVLDAEAQQVHAADGPGNPDRRRLELVLRPVPGHLAALGLLPGPARRSTGVD